MNHKLLRSFILEYDGQLLTKPFTTTREFGRWVEAAFTQTDPLMVKNAIYIKDGQSRHPGTPINGYFEKRPVVNQENRQRSFLTDSEIMVKLIQEGHCTLADANKQVGSEDSRYNVIKCYSITQVELFLRHVRQERGFSLDQYMAKPLVIQCTNKPRWLFDEDGASTIDSKMALFGVRQPLTPAQEQHFKKLNIIRNRYFDKDLMAIHLYSDGDEILNLYKMNTRKLGWEYIKASYNLQLQEMYFEQGSADWHDARIRRDGTFTLGRGVLTGDVSGSSIR